MLRPPGPADHGLVTEHYGASYIVGTGFFSGTGAVNPALTAMANTIRLGEQLNGRMP